MTRRQFMPSATRCWPSEVRRAPWGAQVMIAPDKLGLPRKRRQLPGVLTQNWAADKATQANNTSKTLALIGCLLTAKKMGLKMKCTALVFIASCCQSLFDMCQKRLRITKKSVTTLYGVALQRAFNVLRWIHHNLESFEKKFVGPSSSNQRGRSVRGDIVMIKCAIHNHSREYLVNNNFSTHARKILLYIDCFRYLVLLHATTSASIDKVLVIRSCNNGVVWKSNTKKSRNCCSSLEEISSVIMFPFQYL